MDICDNRCAIMIVSIRCCRPCLVELRCETVRDTAAASDQDCVNKHLRKQPRNWSKEQFPKQQHHLSRARLVCCIGTAYTTVASSVAHCWKVGLLLGLASKSKKQKTKKNCSALVQTDYPQACLHLHSCPHPLLHTSCCL